MIKGKRVHFHTPSPEHPTAWGDTSVDQQNLRIARADLDKKQQTFERLVVNNSKTPFSRKSRIVGNLEDAKAKVKKLEDKAYRK